MQLLKRKFQVGVLVGCAFLATACLVKFDVQTTVVAVTALPPSISTLLPTQFRPPVTVTSPSLTYTVVANDTCISIAVRFNIDVQALEKANGLSQDCPLAVNQVLLIPQPAGGSGPVATNTPLSGSALTATTEEQTASPYISYVVQVGDTLYSIAQRYSVDLQAIMALNNLNQADPFPGAGQVLLIPLPKSTQAPAATPDPYSPYFVDSLRTRTYEGGTIAIVSTVEQTDTYTTYAITYPSDGLKITGLMNVPNGNGPFPVAILNHGHIDETIYKPGDDTKAAADFFARQGFLTLSTSYRNQGGSDTGNNYFRTGYAIDVLNLIASVKTVPQADANNLVVWGHSMGGGVSLEVAVVNPPQVKGYVLYAPMSGDFTANYYRIAWFRGWATPGPDWPVPPESAPAAYAAMSPLNYISDIERPIRIHQGYIDDQVPADWSLHLNTALTLAGKDSQLYNYANANHNFYNDDWNLFMNRSLEFFKQVLK